MRRWLTRGLLAAILVAGGERCATAAQPTHMAVKRMATIEQLIGELGRPALNADQKQAVKRSLVARGKEAIPPLIDHINDPHIYEEHRDVQNYMGLPARGPRPSPIYADITVGSQCQEMLYDIITPRYQSPYAKPIKPYSGSMLAVRDWRAWWLKNKGKSLAQIHEELKPLVDRYWQQHGTEQVVQL